MPQGKISIVLKRSCSSVVLPGGDSSMIIPSSSPASSTSHAFKMFDNSEEIENGNGLEEEGQKSKRAKRPRKIGICEKELRTNGKQSTKMASPPIRSRNSSSSCSSTSSSSGSPFSSSNKRRRNMNRKDENEDREDSEEDDRNDEEALVDDDDPVPAAFRLVNGTESSEESDEERSEHEEEVIRRSRQIRNRERWELLKYKMITECCQCSSNNQTTNKPEGEEEEWNEEREREFVFSLL